MRGMDRIIAAGVVLLPHVRGRSVITREERKRWRESPDHERGMIVIDHVRRLRRLLEALDAADELATAIGEHRRILTVDVRGALAAYRKQVEQ